MLEAILVALAASLIVASVGLWMLRPGDRIVLGCTAPSFALTDQDGRVRRLSDYAGRWLVLYFYPRDDTPGCTRQACAFRDELQALRELNAEVAGVSVDDTDSHARFAEKYALPFPLLSDPGGKVAAAYGSLVNLGPVRFARRRTFVVAPDGRITARFDKVDPVSHAGELARTLWALQTHRATVGESSQGR